MRYILAVMMVAMMAGCHINYSPKKPGLFIFGSVSDDMYGPHVLENYSISHGANYMRYTTEIKHD